MKTFSGKVVYETEEEYVVVADDEAAAEVKITQAVYEDFPPGVTTLLEIKDIEEVSHT